METVPVSSLCEFDFMKCRKCDRICTNTEVSGAIGENGTGVICLCGSIKYQPYQITWKDYCLPQVVRCSRVKFGPSADSMLMADMVEEMLAQGYGPTAIDAEKMRLVSVFAETV